MIARLLRLIAVLLAGLLLGVGAFAALVALGVVRNPLDPVIGGDIALARSARPGQRVLFVGNSLTYYHDMPEMVGRLAAADPGPKPLIVVSYTRGAARLSDFAGDGGLGRLLHEVRWDDVVLQEQSKIPSLPPAERAQQMDPAARTLNSLINAAGARTLLFMTAGYEHGNGSGDSYQAMQLRLATRATRRSGRRSARTSSRSASPGSRRTCGSPISACGRGTARTPAPPAPIWMPACSTRR